MNEQDDLIGDMIAEVACSHGVAISRDDPVMAVVLLNQIVLRRYLEETVARVVPWGWIAAAMLMGTATTVALAVVAWAQLMGQ